MIARPTAARFLVILVAISAIAIAACSSDADPTATPTGPAGLPVAFPYIFSGNFTVAGEPGPEGVPMFARLGEGRGLFNDTPRSGEYNNVSVAPERVEDVGKEITFHLGHPDGPNVQAEETYVFISSGQPQFIELDLTFPRLP